MMSSTVQGHWDGCFCCDSWLQCHQYSIPSFSLDDHEKLCSWHVGKLHPHSSIRTTLLCNSIPQWHSEWRMLLVIWVHLDLIVPRKTIHEGYPFEARHVVNHDISDGQRKFVLRTGCVEITKVDANFDLFVLLEHKDNISNLVWTLLFSNEATFDELMNFGFDCFHDARLKSS